MDTSKISSAAEAKNFLLSQRNGLLSTISLSQSGYPFGSLAPYDIDEEGNVYIYVSLIAEHYKNLLADSRASLMAFDPAGLEDPQAYARATLIADFNLVSDADRPAVQKRYEERFPNSLDHKLAHNFVYLRGNARKIRWIGGFGDIRWIDGDAYRDAKPDALAYHSHEIVSHMNEDHVEALKDFVRAYGSPQSGVSDVRMLDITAAGFRIRVQGAQAPVYIKFPQPLERFEDARPAIIALLKEARKKNS